MKMTREYIEAAIRGISEQMKGPLLNVERQMLYEDRKDFRQALAELNAKEAEVATLFTGKV